MTTESNSSTSPEDSTPTDPSPFLLDSSGFSSMVNSSSSPRPTVVAHTYYAAPLPLSLTEAQIENNKHPQLEQSSLPEKTDNPPSLPPAGVQHRILLTQVDPQPNEQLRVGPFYQCPEHGYIGAATFNISSEYALDKTYYYTIFCYFCLTEKLKSLGIAYTPKS